jgi:hypothetical protein
MLENEMWQLCPIGDGFSVRDLKDYRTFMARTNTTASPTMGGTRSGASLLAAYVQSNMNPFSTDHKQEHSDTSSNDAKLTSPRSKATTSSSSATTTKQPDAHSDDEEVDAELMQDFVEDGGVDAPAPSPARRKDSLADKGTV